MSDSVAPDAPRTGGASPELISELLRHLPTLESLVGRGELPIYLDGVEEIEAAPQEVLFRQGARVERVLLLVKGSVEEVRAHTVDGSERRLRLRVAGPGTLLGSYDLIYRRPHSTWGRALEHSTLVSIPAAQVTRLLYRFPALRNNLLPVERMKRLRTIPMLAKVDAVPLSYLADAVTPKVARAGETLYQAGDDATRLYLIDRGQVLLEYEDSRTLWLGTGAEFGIGDRLSAPPGEVYRHDHNARALCDSDLLTLPRRDFFAITGLSPEREGDRQRRIRRRAMQGLSPFAGWKSEDRERLLGYMSHYAMPASYLVTQQGEPVDSMWVLLPDEGALLHALDAEGDAMPESHVVGLTWFNESVLREPLVATATIEAEAGSAWLRLHHEDFGAFLAQGGHPDLRDRLNAAWTPPHATEVHRRRRFPWLEEGETVVLDIRRHWVALVRKTAPAILLTLFAIVATATLFPYAAPADGGMPNWFWAYALLLVATLVAWMWGVLDYYNDYLVVTTRRVVHQEKLIFVKNHRYMAPLESIRDVQSSGEWWANFLGYARLEVQTPGTLGNIVFDQAAKSKPVVDVIRAQRALRARQARITGKKQIHTMLENRLGVALDLPPRVVQSRQEAAQEAGAQAKSAQNARRTHRRPVTLAPDGQPTRIVWRQHWIILLRNILFQILIVAGLLAGAVFFLYTTRFEAWRNSLSLTMMLSALLIALWTVWILEDWRLDMYILEMEQVIDIERKPFGFDRNQRTALLTDIVDIRFEQPSPLHILFNYGSVFLQTAATDGQFTFLNLSDPQRAAEIIRRRRDQMQVRNEQNSAMQRAEEFPDWLEIYTRLQPGRLE